MNYIKINNINDNGKVDYKGINISENIAGSQGYDFENNLCVFISKSETIPTHKDIEIITEQEYNTLKGNIKELVPKSENLLEEKVLKLEKENEELKQAIAEITMMIATPSE